MKTLLLKNNETLMVSPPVSKRYSNSDYKVYGDRKGLIVVRRRDKAVALCADWDCLGQILDFNCKLIGVF